MGRLYLVGVAILLVLVSSCGGSGWSTDDQEQVRGMLANFEAPPGLESGQTSFDGCTPGALSSCGGLRSMTIFSQDREAVRYETVDELCAVLLRSLEDWDARTSEIRDSSSRVGRCSYGMDLGIEYVALVDGSDTGGRDVPGVFFKINQRG